METLPESKEQANGAVVINAWNRLDDSANADDR
jgi:hypothetical protein